MNKWFWLMCGGLAGIILCLLIDIAKRQSGSVQVINWVSDSRYTFSNKDGVSEMEIGFASDGHVYWRLGKPIKRN